MVPIVKKCFFMNIIYLIYHFLTHIDFFNEPYLLGCNISAQFQHCGHKQMSYTTFVALRIGIVDSIFIVYVTFLYFSIVFFSMVTTMPKKKKKKKKKGTCCFCEISFLAGNVLAVPDSLPRLEIFQRFSPKWQSNCQLSLQKIMRNNKNIFQIYVSSLTSQNV